MFKLRIVRFFPVILTFSLIAVLFSCRTQRKTGYAMMAEVRDIMSDVDTAKPIYLTGTRRIDSADPYKLIFDIWRIEYEGYYPDSIRVYARVFDSSGHFITNMGDPYKLPEDTNNYFSAVTETLGEIKIYRTVPIDPFHVREFGANDSIPYNIVMSVDYSGSMKAVMDAIYEGTELFVSMKMKYDNIALSSFTKEYDLKVPLENDSAKIIHLYRSRKKRGLGVYSAMNDALDSSMAIYEDLEEDVPRVLVVFSDGDDNYSKNQVEDLIKRAKENNIHIFTVAFGYSKDDQMRELAQHTGGKFYKAYTKKELIAIFRDIYMSLRYYYLITYKPPRFWGWHNVFAVLNVPPRPDTLIAKGKYNTSDLWKGIGDEFTRPILFDFDSAVVKPQSYYILDEIATAMYESPKIRLEIQGHTDNIGGIDYNQDLSERRAKAVYNGLLKRGVEPYRLRWRGFGMSVPVASNDTEEGQAKNRRTVFKILAK